MISARLCLLAAYPISERYETSTLVFMDGSKLADEMGFDVYVPGVQHDGYRLHEPKSVFTAEISAQLDALLFIKSSQLSEYFFLSDSLNISGCCGGRVLSNLQSV
jgi:hypothetical protein